MSRCHIVVINSVDRLSPLETSSQFTVAIRPAIVNAKSVSLKYATIPNSTYNITAANNSLSFDDGSVITVTIAPGSYNTTTLAAAVAAAMTAAGSQVYTVTYNPTTYHYTISAPGFFSLFYEFFTSRSIFPTLGFRYNANSFPALSFESNAAVQLWRSSYFMIRIDKVPFSAQTTKANNNFGAFIINNATSQDGTVIEWRENSQYRQTIDVNTNMDNLYVQLVDETGGLADINSSEWSFSLLVEY